MTTIEDAPIRFQDLLWQGTKKWLWPILTIFLLLIACLTGGANTATSSQLLSATSGILLFLVLLDRRSRECLTRLPDFTWIMVGFAFVILTMASQFLPFLIFTPPAVVWTRPDMVTIDPDRTLRAISAIWAPVSFFLIGAILAADRYRRQALTIMFAVFAIALLGHSALDYFETVTAWRDPTAPDVVRLNGAFVSANTLASILILTAMAAAGLYASEAPRRGGKGRPYARRIAIAICALALIGLLGTMSRAGWIVCAFLFTGYAMIARPEKRGIIVSVGALLSMLMMVVSTFGQEWGLPVRRVDLLGSLLDRLPEWRIGWELAIARPFLGWGAGTFSLAMEPLQVPPTQSMTLVPTTPHNFLLLIAAETGVVGLIAWGVLAAALATFAVKGITEGRAFSYLAQALVLGLAGVLFHNLVDYSLAVPAAACVFALVLGFVGGLGARRPRKLIR